MSTSRWSPFSASWSSSSNVCTKWDTIHVETHINQYYTFTNKSLVNSSENIVAAFQGMHVSPANYCKRGYFRWGKISRKSCQDISRGGNFHDTTLISFIKAYGFYFRVGVIFAKTTKSRKTRKLPPRENFHVYSIAMRDYWTDRHTHTQTDRQTDAGKSDPYVPLCRRHKNCACLSSV